MHPIPILLYHSVDEDVHDTYRRWAVTPNRFASHMKTLAVNGYSVLDVTTVISRQMTGQALPKKLVILTFDDGLRDFLDGAFPILRKYQFKATLYVAAGHVGRTSSWLAPLGEGNRPMLNAREIRELHANGIEIGAHSLTHPELDLLDRNTCAREISGSRNVLENIIDAPVLSFAYPHGYASRATRELARKAGFLSAVRVRHALSGESEDRFGLSRLIVTQDVDEQGLLSLLEGSGVPMAPPQDRLAGTCWRMVRQARRKLRGPQILYDAPAQAGGAE